MDQERKNKRSTTTSSKDATLNDSDAADRPGERTHACYVTSVTDQSFTPTGRVYSDQTGRFAVPSANGNKYIMVVYDYDSNYVFLEAFRTRTAACLLAAYKNIHARLVSAGLRPQYQTLDSEISDAFKAFLRTVGVTYQLVPPGVHRRNAAERAIRTVQNHFIAGLCSTDPNFPIFLWDKLLPQAELTLNLLRGSRLNPKLSAWAQVNGVFDYQRTPIGPPGTRVLVHDKPDQRSTWSPHGLEAWYIGPALEYYRCFRCWVWDTRKERVCDTLRWHPARVRLPASSSTDTIILCLKDIAAALRHPAPRSPLAPLTDAQNKALRDIVTILNNNVGGSVTFDSDDAPPDADSPSPHPLRGQRVPSAEEDATQATFDEVTGPRGRRLRRSRRQHLREAESRCTGVESTPSEETRAPPRRSKRTPKPKKQFSALCEIGSTSMSDDPPHPPLHRMPAEAMPCMPAEQWCLHGTAINPDSGNVAEYPELSQCRDGLLWQASNTEEIERMIDKTQTMSFIHRRELPANKRATYIRVVCADRPEKDNPRRVRWTIGGDRIVYPGNKSTKTADLVTVKLLLNSTISTRGGRFMTLDLSDFYLYSVLPDPEYVRIPLTLLPPAVIERYNLQDKIYQGHVYARVDKGMYGLPQAGKLETLRVARDLLLEQLDGGVRWFTIDGREGRMREANGRLGVGHGWRWSAVGVFSLILETLEHFYFKKNSRGGN